MTQCLLRTLEYVSAIPGCEPFTLKYDGGLDLNANIKEPPEINTLAYDLFPVINNTEH